VTADGAIWATLQNGNQLLQIAADGTGKTFDLPRGAAVPTDVAIGSGGSVWFLQFRANRIGRFKDGQFWTSRRVGKMPVSAALPWLPMTTSGSA